MSLSKNGRRYIVHVDIDAFFAAVEVLLDPSLAGKPVIVGGLPHERGVASTCSYEARAFGVHSGMPLRECYRLCPQGVFVRGNYHVYEAFSERFFRVLHAATPDVEEASLDEAYLELTRCGHIYPSFTEAARELKRQVEREIGVTVSVGAAPNKILAKLATRRAKPAGFFEIREGEEETYLRDLGIEALPGIGPKAQVVLRLMNIHKIGELWELPRGTLHTLFGAGGDDIYLQSRGIDSRPLVTRTLPKSVSRETTFLEDLWDKRLLLAHLAYLCDRLTLALREDRLYAPRSSAASSCRRSRRWARSTRSPRNCSLSSWPARGWPCAWSGSRPRTSSGSGPWRSSSPTRSGRSGSAGPSTRSATSTASARC